MHIHANIITSSNAEYKCIFTQVEKYQVMQKTNAYSHKYKVMIKTFVKRIIEWYETFSSI